MSNQPTCEERIVSHLEGRLADIGAALRALRLEPQTGDLERIEADSDDSEVVEERAQEYLWNLPLAVSRSTVFRIELSTGGPADYLEIFCNQDEERPEIVRIVYHFADWFDHAQRDLTGDDLKVAEDFAHQIIPDLQ